MAHTHNNPFAPEVTFEHHQDDAAFKAKVKKTTIWLTLVTIIEVVMGLMIYKLHDGVGSGGFLILFIKGAICILTMFKAYWIVMIFMHLGDEIKSFKMTILIPTLLFVWFIIAFLADGNSYKNLKNKFDPHFYESTTPDKLKKEKASNAVSLEEGRK